jgi:hypothetical protein
VWFRVPSVARISFRAARSAKRQPGGMAFVPFD